MALVTEVTVAPVLTESLGQTALVKVLTEKMVVLAVLGVTAVRLALVAWAERVVLA
jgi:hypothetical protein